MNWETNWLHRRYLLSLGGIGNSMIFRIGKSKTTFMQQFRHMILNGVYVCPWADLLVRLVSVDLHTFGPDALTAVRLMEHQAAGQSQVAEVRPQLVEQLPAPLQGAPIPGEHLYT